MRFGELFAGAGGLSLGLERAGWECAWHAEIADQPRAILSHRWPAVPLLGDVTAIDGRELAAKFGAIDLLSGGSPCQDLSVAGKRKGLEGARSGLFYEQMRLWDETGADLCLWENVDGARSSNNGKDFGEVLRAFVGVPSLFPRTDGEARVWQRDLWESPHGAYWTPSTSGFHRGAAASLSSVLEPAASIPPKYYLSPKACAGILRRAEKRGKELPAALIAALRSLSAQSKPQRHGVAA